MSETIARPVTETLYILRRPDKALIVGTLVKTRAEAERLLTAEFPPGHIIYPYHTVATVRLEVIDG